MKSEIAGLIGQVRGYLGACAEARGSFSKEDRSPVTVADVGVQVLVNRMIRLAFPNDRIIAEEKSSAVAPELLERARGLLGVSEAEFRETLDYRGKGTGPVWMIDPIDGTKGYLRGEQYAVAIARFDGETPLMGCLVCPNLPFPDMSASRLGSVLYWDRESFPVQAAFDDLADEVELGRSRPVAQAILRSVEKEHGDFSVNDELARRLGITSALALDSQAKYALLARGEASVYLRAPRDKVYKEKVWDHAAGWALLKATGGELTDVRGAQPDFRSGERLETSYGIVATAGIEHEKVVDALRELVK